jgi:outer membrane immunogenic protein
MKRLAAAVATVTLIGTPAFAAPPAPPAVYNWTGWYAGENAGASFGNVKTDFNAPFTVSLGGFTANFSDFAGAFTAYPSGFMGGGQIGYNWQYSPLIVVGFEADFQGTVERDSSNLGISLGATTTNDTLTAVTNLTAKIDWFGTVRGRIGYVWGNGNVLSYVTGGLAYGRVELDGSRLFSASHLCPFDTPKQTSAAASNTPALADKMSTS